MKKIKKMKKMKNMLTCLKMMKIIKIKVTINKYNKTNGKMLAPPMRKKTKIPMMMKMIMKKEF